MDNHEFDISTFSYFHCKRCPNREKLGGYKLGYVEHPSCPRDLAMQELGINPSTEKLYEMANKFGLVFNGQVGWINKDTDKEENDLIVTTANFECPNAEGGVSGMLTAKFTEKK